ncbi:MAG TPA: allantoate amidohydrolase [Solirubrobacteraceae bacterium]|jgi:N-carbamoyl-L-amino-acid hydrolase|nr:allantoate amidohydrolase [Solirubrobacteraceae bacterium]
MTGLPTMSSGETAYTGELFEQLFGELSAIGLDQQGATTRLAWSEEAAEAAAWFDRTARRLGLDPQVDKNGNRWAWTCAPTPAAIVTGSHLDSVREGGRFDGALGVVAGLIAVHLLSRRGVQHPLAVISFADEEGGRFDTPTFGSRAMLGALDVQPILERRDREGVTLREALAGAGLQPTELGPDPERVRQIGALVEVHIEQDTLLTERDRQLALGTRILPHGRWRIDLTGEANHAGTTPLAIRRDPMLTLAATLTAARRVAADERSLATIGKLEVSPNATNAIAERVSLWLDVRGDSDEAVERTAERILSESRADADANGITLVSSRESFTAAVSFSPELRSRVAAILAGQGIEDVPMSTGAGHDSGALANAVPTAMLFVRSATGASHCSRELASVEDCVFGIGALTEILAALAKGPS